jgi:hypothetical protein
MWFYALASVLALYVPQSPLILTLLKDDVDLMLLPSIPAMFFVMFIVNYHIDPIAYLVVSYSLTLAWIGWLVWLSFKDRQKGWEWILISACVSAGSGTILFMFTD